jgi:hypothetical protein
LFTVARTVIVSVSTGEVGVHDTLDSVRSGFGAGTPITWSSATCPAGAPVLPVKFSRTSATRALTGIVTLFPLAGLKLYAALGTIVVNPEALCSRPRIEKVCVRGPQAESGLSRITIELRSALEPSWVVSVAGLASPSQ